jgi:cation diffusion facilitator family transporter
MGEESNIEAKAANTAVQKVAFSSLLVNIFLVGSKVFLSIISGSLALRADAIHSFIDVFSSIALLAGMMISTRRSENFPYGLYKVENIVSIIISLLLLLTAYEIVSKVIWGETTVVAYSYWVLLAVATLIPIPLIFGRYEIREGKRTNSPSLIADGNQFSADALTASIVLFALIGQRFGLPVDNLAAVIISVFIVKAGWEILISGMRVLLDASVDAETLQHIRALILAEPAVSEVKDVIARNSGRYLFVETSVSLKIADLAKANLIGQRIEARIKGEISNVDRVLIHYEPAHKKMLRYAVPLADLHGKISQHFGESPYFALVDIDIRTRELRKQEIIANPHKDLPKGKGLKVAEFLLGYKPDIVMAKENISKKGPGYALAEAGVIIIQTEASSLEEQALQVVI